jgi:hypothetical protein
VDVLPVPMAVNARLGMLYPKPVIRAEAAGAKKML